MISIVKRPYDGLWSNHNPVYNGLNFIVDSDKKFSPQFRYIAEIYAGSSITNQSKVGELRHNPDISYSNQGVFDVGRVLEDYITYNLAWNALGVNDNSNHYKTYYVAFGEEYGRTLNITVIKNQSGKNYIGFGTTHNLIAGYSSILIQGTSLADLNQPWLVSTVPNNGAVTINLPYQSGVSYTNAYAIQGAYATNGLQTYTGADGGTYYSFIHTGPGDDVAFAEVGDGIQVFPVDTSITFLGGTYQILSKAYNSNYECYEYRTNIPYVSNMNTKPVHIFPTGPIQVKAQLTTKNDQAVTWNSVFQYEDILDYDSKPFAPYQKNTKAKFLTDRPRVTPGSVKMNMCLSDYYSVGYLAQYGMPSNGGTKGKNIKGLLVEVWTKSNPSPVTTTTLSAISRAGTVPNTLWNYTAVKVPGNQVSNYTQGSYITLLRWELVGSTWTSYTTQQRVIGTVLAGTSTNILIDILYNGNMNNSALHQWTITCTQRVIFRTDNWDMNDQNAIPRAYNVRLENGIGPKNLALNNYQEFQTDDVKKYFVSLWGFDNTLNPQRLNSCYYKNTVASETWEITVTDCPCETAYRKYTIFWMNKLGGWDYFNFTARTDKARKIEERQQFRRTLYNYGTFANGQKGQSTYNTLAHDEWTLNTDWLSQAEIDWIQDIYESPEVYIILKDHTNDFIKAKPATFDPSAVKDIVKPVNVTNEEVILGNKKNRGEAGGLFQYQITVSAANRRDIQRGSNYGGNYFYNRS